MSRNQLAEISGVSQATLSAIDPEIREWSDDTEEANLLYWAVLPDDGELFTRFEGRLRDRPNDFGPSGDAS